MIRVFYQRLCQVGKAKKLTLMACMRKLRTLLSAMLKSGTPWGGGESVGLIFKTVADPISDCGMPRVRVKKSPSGWSLRRIGFQEVGQSLELGHIKQPAGNVRMPVSMPLKIMSNRAHVIDPSLTYCLAC